MERRGRSEVLKEAARVARQREGSCPSVVCPPPIRQPRPPYTPRTCALMRYSPYSLRSPVEGLRVKHTPVPEVGPMLPNAMACANDTGGESRGYVEDQARGHACT